MTRFLSLAFVAVLPLLVGCSLGQGDGEVRSEQFFAPDCWGVGQRQPYDLNPDFFAADPDYNGTMFIVVQRGSDQKEYSDGLEILIDDVTTLRSRLKTAEPVALSSGIGAEAGRPPPPPTSPLLDSPSLIHMSLYLQHSCHNQGTVLNAISGTITFTHLFSGDPNEQKGSEKLTDATFDVVVGDLQQAPAGEPASAVPASDTSHLTGNFRFYFERGQPAQPFP